MLIKFSFLTFVLLFVGSSAGVNIKASDIDEKTKEYIRTTFYAGVEDESKAEELKNYIDKKFGKKLKSMSPFVLAYLGGAETLLAKHAINPFTKLDLLNSGLDKIAFAIKKQPNSLEIRFMRFSILHFIPAILGHSKERDEDLEVIYGLLLKKDYSELDKKTQTGLVKFLLESERLDKNKSAKLRTLLK